MVLGEQQLVNQQNELAVLETLREVCEQVMRRSQSGLEELEELRKSLLAGTVTDVGWTMAATSCIAVLWQEEQEVASALLESIEHGEPLY